MHFVSKLNDIQVFTCKICTPKLNTQKGNNRSLSLSTYSHCTIRKDFSQYSLIRREFLDRSTVITRPFTSSMTDRLLCWLLQFHDSKAITSKLLKCDKNGQILYVQYYFHTNNIFVDCTFCYIFQEILLQYVNMYQRKKSIINQLHTPSNYLVTIYNQNLCENDIDNTNSSIEFFFNNRFYIRYFRNPLYISPVSFYSQMNF